MNVVAEDIPGDALFVLSMAATSIPVGVRLLRRVRPDPLRHVAADSVRHHLPCVAILALVERARLSVVVGRVVHVEMIKAPETADGELTLAGVGELGGAEEGPGERALGTPLRVGLALDMHVPEYAGGVENEYGHEAQSPSQTPLRALEAGVDDEEA